MLRALLLLAALAGLTYWQSTGAPWLRAVPGWVFPALAAAAGLFLLYRLLRWLYVSLTDFSD